MDASGAVSSAHALIREVVYDSLPLTRRQALHARAADWTTGDRRLGHRAAAVSRPDPALVAELVGAADLARSSRRYALAAAQRLRARSVSADPDQRDALLFEALIDRVSAQDLDGADELAERAAELTPSPVRSLALGLLARERGRVAEATTYFQEALSPTSEPRLRQQAAVALAELHVRLNEGALALAALDSVDDPELAGDARTARAIGRWRCGRHRDAMTHLEALPLSPQGVPWEAELLATRAAIHLFTGEVPAAQADLDRCIEMSHLWRPSGNQTVTYMYHLAGVYAKLGISNRGELRRLRNPSATPSLHVVPTADPY